MSGPLMVGVSGCRGIVGQSLTPEVAARFAGAFAGFLTDRFGPGPAVVLGRDGRAGSQMVHHAALAGLIGAGVKVVDVGVAMTPTVATAVDRHRAPAGMVLTASHNPQEWNGLKCLLAENRDTFDSAACAPAAAVAAQIVDRFRAGKPGLVPWSGIGAVEIDGAATPAHVDRVLGALSDALAVDPESVGVGRAVVLDSVNASGGEGGITLLERVACEEIMHIGGQATGLFPHPPEPTKANLSSLCESVREMDAAVGFAQDPDADRLALVDEKGSYIGEEYTLALCSLAALEAWKENGGRGTPTLVCNLSTSRMLDDIAARFGGRVLRSAVGEANVVEAMKREGAIAGGEGNGGIIWPRVTYVRDSLSGIALVLALMAKRQKPLSRIVAEIPSYAIVKDKIDLPRREDADPTLEKLARAFASERVDRQDGVWVGFDKKRAWLHVRASNTEPIMRLIAEAPTEAEARALLEEARRVSH